jgi:hypothetical protein
MANDDPICVRCDRPVRASREQFDVFERMHYVCFHYEFAHDPADPDEECKAGGCPSGALAGGRDKAAETAARLASEAARGASWPNDVLHVYLQAFSAWLTDSDGYYANQHRVRPSNGWEVVTDALQAATIYE